MADDLAEVLFREQLGGGDPALDHRCVPPAGHVHSSLLDTALRAFDDVDRPQTLVECRRQLQPLNRKHLGHAVAQAASRRLVFMLEGGGLDLDGYPQPCDAPDFADSTATTCRRNNRFQGEFSGFVKVQNTQNTRDSNPFADF